MLENARGMMIGLSVVSWILATILVVTVLRVTLRAEMRGWFKRIAHVYTASVLLIMVYTVARISWTEVVLPGWFYACMFMGILIPWQIALYAAGIDKEAHQQTQ